MIKECNYYFFNTEIFDFLAKCVLQYKVLFCDYLG